ncbi:hypothetical protein Hypma_007596 [Hypsizygus marmoreus]|uniref:Cyanovirin-N domain-containing protein n=1 Tax=Hypsizygus marmoreus TaxID=39966 RepID=A0A369K2Y0_HYPMA|nr:hypothetical protein Hypma_007596 [Hypsizygus marmoreus]
MKIGFILPYALALFVSTSVARPSIWESCGSDAVLLKESTFEHDGHVVKVATTSCPGFANLTSTTFATPSRVNKRAVSQCNLSLSACNVLCDSLLPQPTVLDCNTLTLSLLVQPNTFSSPPFTFTTFTMGTCLYGFANFDLVTYDVCPTALAIYGLKTSTQCVAGSPSTLTGFCTSLGLLNNNWVMEVVHS